MVVKDFPQLTFPGGDEEVVSSTADVVMCVVVFVTDSIVTDLWHMEKFMNIGVGRLLF